jgi:Autotransporter beta-domain
MFVRKISLRGCVALATLLLPGIGRAQDFVIHNGQTAGNQLMVGASDVGIIEAFGTIDGHTDDVDAVYMAGDGQRFENLAGGILLQTGDRAVGIFSDGLGAEIANSGLIVTSAAPAYGIFTLGNNARVTNNGMIETLGLAATAIISAGGNALVRNDGTLRASGPGASGIILDGADGVFVNRGLIETTDVGSSGILVGYDGDGTTISNSGRIISSLDPSSEAIGIGFGADDVTLELLAGSVIQGQLNVAGTNSHINIGHGVNTALTFNFFNSVNLLDSVTLDTAENPYATRGGLLAVVDPAALSTFDEILADISGGFAGALENRSASLRQGVRGNEAWIKTVNGYREKPINHSGAGFTNLLTGIVAGVDTDVSFATRAGVFAGFSVGEMETNTRSQTLDYQNFAAGAYSHFGAEEVFLDLSVTGGVVNFNSERQLLNNLVLGGIEHATAELNGGWISPAATAGVHFAAGSNVVTPSLRARYAGLLLEDFGETGSAANLRVSGNNSHIVELRGQVAVTLAPFAFYGGDVETVFRAGIDGSFRNQSSIDGDLLGQSLRLVDSNHRSAARGFVAVDANYSLANGWQVDGSMELGIDSDDGFTAAGVIGINIPL